MTTTDATLPAAAALTVAAVSCGDCGATRWPAQDYGCEVCGAHGPALRQVQLRARGTLRSYAWVFRHPSVPEPYLVVEVQLLDGPLVRSLGVPDLLPWTGQPVRAVRRGLQDRLVFGPVEQT